MSFVNEYILNVDIKRRMSNVVPTFKQGDTARLKFKIFDNGKAYDLTSFTNAEITFKVPRGETIIGNPVKEDEYIVYDFQGAEMEQVGNITVILTIMSGNTEVSIQPFKIFVYDKMKNENISYIGVLQDLIAETQQVELNALEVINQMNTTRDELELDAVNYKNTLVQDVANYKTDVNNFNNQRKHLTGWNSTTQYRTNNEVSFNGSSWRALRDNKGVTPVEGLDWTLVARKGADGNGTVHIHYEKFIATEGQTVFNLQHSYDQLQNRIWVNVGGIEQYSPNNFEETSQTSITFTEGLPSGTVVKIRYFSEAVPLQADYETRLENLQTTFSLKHNADGSFKTGIITGADILDGTISNTEINLTSTPTTTGKAIRWDEFTVKHNNDGTFKTGVISSVDIANDSIDNTKINLTTTASLTGDAIRWDEFSVKHNNDGTFKAGIINGTDISNLTITGNNIANETITNDKINLTSAPTGTGKAIRWDEFSNKHNNDGTFKVGIITGNDIAGTTITSNNIANGTITNTQISATAGIVGTQLANGTISNTQISTTASIDASKLAIQKMYKKSINVIPSATADTFGTVVDLIPAVGYLALIPQMLDVVFGGTFGTETVTVDITVTYGDTTTGIITKTATATGTVSLTSTDLFTLIKDNTYINKISLKAKSSIASTLTTITVNHYGFYL